VEVTRTVNVVDTTPPNLVLNGTDMTIECGSSFTDPGATATDVCAGSVPVVIGGSVNTSIPAVYTLTYDATDGANAAPTQTRTVTVVDTLGPEITVIGSTSQTVVAGQSFTDQGATALDACEGSVAVITGGDVVNPNLVGVYVITCDAVDSGGRAAVQRTRTVNVVAGNPPEITVLGDPVVTVECGGSYTDAGATATDVEDDDTILTGNIVVGGLPIPVGVPGSYLVTYNVTDSSGNPATQQTRTVIVEDTQAPILTLQGSATVTVSCGGAYTDAGATATDVCDDNTLLTSNIVVTGLPIPIGTPGNYTVTYNVTDSAGNSAAAISRTVDVIDVQVPTLSLQGAPVVTVECGGNYQDAGAVAFDNCDDDAALTSAIVVGGLPINTNVLGPRTITYNVTDQVGNSATQITRSVMVQDTGAPVINLNGASVIQIDLGGTYNEAGATANDLCEGDVPVVIGGDVVNTAAVGVYIVTYDAVDSSGNAAVQRTRQVSVIAGEAPFITEQPASQSVTYNDDAIFTVSAVALAAMTYQWFKDGAPLSNGAQYGGVNTDTLTVFASDKSDEGGYSCRVTSLGVSVNSVTAQLTVNDPGITLQPVGQVVAPGSTVQFEVAAAGSGTLIYQWMRGNFPLTNGVRISGADGPLLSIANADKALDEGEYYCIVDGGADPPIESNRANLIVGNPLIVKNPDSLEVLAGANAVFEVEAVGVAPLIYVWRKNGQNLVASGKYTGISTPTLTILNVDESDEGVYTCRVVGQNIVESNGATLKVLGAPVIDGVQTIPASGIVPLQGPAAFTVIVSDGATPFTYQWRRNGVAISNDARISGANSATMTISSSILADTGSYDCLVTNGVDTVGFDSVSLTVGLTFTQQLGPSIGEHGKFFQWSVGVAGSLGDPLYQWMKNDGNKSVFLPVQDGPGISGATTNTLNFNPLDYADAGIYRVEVTDNFSTYTSNQAELQVVASLPLSAFGLLMALTGVLAAAGLGVLRRRRQKLRA